MLMSDLTSPVPIAPPLEDTVAVRLRLIGQMEAVTLDGRSVLPPGKKTRALLAIVALAAPRPVLRARLAELLWSRRPEEQARASLRQEIHRLLDVLVTASVDIITVARDHIVLRSDVVWIDVDEVTRATPDDPAALDRLDGQLLEDLDGVDPAFDTWLKLERDRLRDRARAVAEALLLAQTTPEAVIAAAQRLLAIDQAHEGAWRALMRAHAEHGERGMAIQAYDRCRAALSELMDATPSPETQRLLAEIRGEEVHPPAPPPAEPPPARRPFPRAGPRIGVMPFRASGGDDEAMLAIGLTAEITAALARYRSLFLVSITSATLAAEAGDRAALRTPLGLDFVLTGSVRRGGDLIRVSAQLREVRNGEQVVWGRHFDCDPADPLTAQDETAAAIAAQLDSEIMMAESRRALLAPNREASPYELVLHVMPALSRLERDEFMAAGEKLRQARESAPPYAAAYAWSSLWMVFLVAQGWTQDRAAALQDAAIWAERAITLDPQDARAFTFAGHVRAYLQRRPREALALHERALALNPSLGPAWALSGAAHLYLGEIAEAEQKLARYKQLLPLDAYAFFYDSTLAMLALTRGDFEAAAGAGRKVSELNPLFATACEAYLSALGHLRETREAATVRRRLLAINPDFTIQLFLTTTPFQRPADRDLFAAGLRLAGITETSAS